MAKRISHVDNYGHIADGLNNIHDRLRQMKRNASAVGSPVELSSVLQVLRTFSENVEAMQNKTRRQVNNHKNYLKRKARNGNVAIVD